MAVFGDICDLGPRQTAVPVPVSEAVFPALSKIFGGFGGLIAAWFVMLSAFSAQAAGTNEAGFLQAKKPIAAPVGFAAVCSQYDWACTGGDGRGMAEADLLLLAGVINTRINNSTPEISDLNQYGTEERWALPTGRGGDCEDFVLLKKREMIGNGIAASRLLIATVLDRQREPHAVLILRTGQGDLVLDNLRNQIRPWRDTGYSFLRMQDPATPGKWNALLAGGMFTKDSL